MGRQFENFEGTCAKTSQGQGNYSKRMDRSLFHVIEYILIKAVQWNPPLSNGGLLRAIKTAHFYPENSDQVRATLKLCDEN